MFLEKPQDFCIIRGACSLITNSSIHLFQPERLAGYPFFSPIPISGLSLIRLDIMSLIKSPSRVESGCQVHRHHRADMAATKERGPQHVFSAWKNVTTFHFIRLFSLFFVQTQQKKKYKIEGLLLRFLFRWEHETVGDWAIFTHSKKAPGSSSKQ